MSPGKRVLLGRVQTPPCCEPFIVGSGRCGGRCGEGRWWRKLQGLRASELFGHSQVEIDISQGFVDVSARSQT